MIFFVTRPATQTSSALAASKRPHHFNKGSLPGGMLQTNSEVAIDMNKRSQGLGFARIAKLVTSKNVNILKKEEAQSNGKEVNITAVNAKENNAKQE